MRGPYRSPVSRPAPEQAAPDTARHDTARHVARHSERSQPASAVYHSPGSGFWLPLAGMALTLTSYALLMRATPSGDRVTVGEGFQVLAYLIGAACCAWGAWRSPVARLRWAWGFFALAFFLNAVAESTYAWLLLVQRVDDPFPSLADPFYLSFYVFGTAGVLLLPAARTGGMQRLKVMLDAAIIAVALLTISWFFLIGPLYFAGADSPLALVLSLAYPGGDLVIVLALVALALRNFARGYRPACWLLIVGMLAFVYADSAYTYLGLQGQYVDGTVPVDGFWILGTFLCALAPLYQVARLDPHGPARDWLPRRLPEPERPRLESSLRFALPYIPAVCVFVLVWLAQSADQRLFPVLYTLVAVEFVLVLGRQGLGYYEHQRQARSQLLRMLALQEKANQRIEQQRRQIEEHARQLEEGIRRLIETQARVAHGDFSARVHYIERDALFPLAMMMNLMLERVESRTRRIAQYEHLTRLLARHVQLLRRLEHGDARVLRELRQPTGTLLDEISQYVARLAVCARTVESGPRPLPILSVGSGDDEHPGRQPDNRPGNQPEDLAESEPEALHSGVE